MVSSWNPATEERLATYALTPPEKVEELLSQTSAKAWAKQPIEARANLLQKLGDQLLAQKRSLAELATQEMGKPIRQSEGEVEKCAFAAHYFAKEGPHFLQAQEVSLGSKKGEITFSPLGTILAIMPWNFPFWQVIRCAVPALLAGNRVLLKHAPNVTGCALALEKIFREAGVQKSSFAALVVDEAKVQELLLDPRIAAVAFTGSPQGGRAVAATAGRAGKKSILELGGSDAYLILEDADLELAATSCVEARCVNSGQSCIAAKRWVICQSVYEKFLELALHKLSQKTYGDPMDPEMPLGPLARRDLREKLHAQVQKSIDQGAKLLLGGRIPPGRGYFYPATLLADVQPGMPAFEEELFGPAAACIRAKSEEEAIALANASPFGLGAAVFTQDLARGEAMVKRLEAGVCAVNAAVQSDPRLPFGGVKASGYGRELGYFGLFEFANIKSIITLSPRA